MGKPVSGRGLRNLLGLGLLATTALMLASAPGEAQVAGGDDAASAAYARQCAPCHGPAGEGTDFGPPVAGSLLDASERESLILDGSSAMPAFRPTLTPEEAAALAALLPTLGAEDETISAGRTLYAEQCSGCHGVEGEGGVAPSLRDGTSPLAELTAVIRDGRGSMPAYGSQLSAAELESVVAFSASLQGPGGPDEPPDEPPEQPPDEPPAESAEQMYATRCASCHGTDGAGGLGPSLLTASLSVDDVVVAVSQGVGTMPGFADQLEPDDIDAVAALVKGLGETNASEPALVRQGAELFVANCARCHGPDAAGGFGPALKYSTLTDVEMVSVISNGFGSMPSFGEILTSADATALVAFVESTREADSGLGDAVTTLAHGREVYVSSCATCHGFDGSGGVAPSLVNSRMTANEIISQVFGIHADRMPAFEGVLDASQVQDVARYVLTIEREPRSRLPWLAAGALVLVLLFGGGVLWFAGPPERLVRRFR